MCGIFGIGLMKGHSVCKETIVEMLEPLFVEATVRGLDASGIASVSQDSIHVLKTNKQGPRFIKTEEYKDFTAKYIDNRTIQILGHTRAAKIGDSSNNLNNQPIIAGKYVGVHNGTINNYKEIETQLKTNGYEKRKGEVDSEVIFNLLDYAKEKESCTTHSSIATASLGLKGTYACACVDSNNPHILWLFKNILPISLYIFEDVGMVVFASSEYFIDKAMMGKGIGAPIKRTMSVEEAMGIDFMHNTISEFAIGHNLMTGVFP